MIVVAGLTPAWQQILRFDALCVGEVNRAREAQWCASGKVLNVGMALSCWEQEAHTICPVGGAAGLQIQEDCAAHGMNASWVTASAPTRVCTTLLDATTGETTELVENAGALSAAELAGFHALYRGVTSKANVAVFTGSLPASVPRTFYRELLEATPCPAILDVRGEELLLALECRPLVVKPNVSELAATLGRTLDTPGTLHAAMAELNDRGARWVVVSQGSAALWVRGEGQLWKVVPPKVDVVNPIGSGDSLAAGIAWGLSEGSTFLDALRLGVAAAVENVRQLLPARPPATAVRRRAESILIEQC